ncbi:MAG: di-heme oxidoredictase family protein [Bacteroidales bacterium]|nr:di-heme oxidoredictase family protein [Bacteroidales bacterium]
MRGLPLFLLASSLLPLVSCDPDTEGIDTFSAEHSRDLEDYYLSAGTSTLFDRTSKAFDTDAEWLSGTYLKRFQTGDRLYDNVADNHGPVYAGYSCGSCHFNAGRTSPGVWNQVGTDSDGSPVYGSGKNGMSAMLVYVTRRNGVFFQDYGRVLHDQSIYGVTAEGKLEVRYDYEDGTFPDGEPYQLAHPNYTIVKWYKKMWDSVRKDSVEIRPEDLFCTVRIPLRHVGMGQMMAVDRAEIERLAAQSNYPEYGISGRANYITERGVRSVGLSGNKAQHLDLTVELGFSSDMGSTNSRYPEEICEGQSQMSQGSMMGLTYAQLDVSTEDMECVDLYLHSLAVPARRKGSTSIFVTLTKSDGSEVSMTERDAVSRGEAMFYQAKCHLCHVPTLHTRPRGATLLNGSQLPWLGSQTIHPYSDYLLHDMGSEIMGVGLNDNYVSGLARGNEWRTTPLWGVGLQHKVNGHTYFLHDGRARNLTEAILWHGGEGEASKNLFKKMDRADRQALIKFLESL